MFWLLKIKDRLKQKYSRNLGKNEGIELVLVNLNNSDSAIRSPQAGQKAANTVHTVDGKATNENQAHGVYIKDGGKVAKP